MIYQLIPAIGLAALIAWCGYEIAQVHPPSQRQGPPAAVRLSMPDTP